MGATRIDELRSSIRGTVIQPGDTGYDAARKVHNGMIDKRPALIVQCVDLSDVMAKVNYARTNNALLAVRGCGHNGGGLGTCDDGVVIDLSMMKGVRADPIARTVRVGAGCTWADVDHGTHPFGSSRGSGSSQRPEDHRVVQGLLRRLASVFGGWRVRELHDGRRPGTGPGAVP